jgi:hypothetical protein
MEFAWIIWPFLLLGFIYMLIDLGLIKPARKDDE